MRCHFIFIKMAIIESKTEQNPEIKSVSEDAKLEPCTLLVRM